MYDYFTGFFGFEYYSTNYTYENKDLHIASHMYIHIIVPLIFNTYDDVHIPTAAHACGFYFSLLLIQLASYGLNTNHITIVTYI